jgi:hypothetical protein
LDLEQGRQVAASLAGDRIDGIDLVRGGGNSRVYRVESADTVYAMKLYPPRTADPRNRRGTESTALSFFDQNSVTKTPRLCVTDAGLNASLLEWIDGAAVDVPDDDDIDCALGFLRSLDALRLSGSAARLPTASEACLSAAELESQILKRLDRLSGAAPDNPSLETMLRHICAAARELFAAAKQGYRDAGLSWDMDVAKDCMTLSPSDFGFHNALRRIDGSLAFIDFEYFGWDDPAKLTCDVLLHPGMNLPAAAADRMLDGMLGLYGRDGGFATRAALLYPLFGLRWCAILLNEFLSDKWAVRAHAGADDIAEAQARQIAKAETMLGKARDPINPIKRALKS